jgi:amino acid adenylation domain-containing protein
MKIEDVYALSPLQEGLYYHWLHSPEAYFEQTTYRLKGKLNSDFLETSYRLLVERHAVLRTVFTNDFGEKVLQLVRKEGQPAFEYIDVSADSTFSPEHFKVADRTRGFDLHRGALMRLTVLFEGNDTYTFVWSHHHILMDGWCINILIREFFQLYHHLSSNTRPVLTKAYPYSAYIKWLEQVDEKKAIQYWADYLAGYQSASPLQGDVVVQPHNYDAKELFLVIDGPLRQAAKNLCESAGVTENILIQAVWGVLLCKYNNTTDVVFGSVVSGRPPEVPGIEQIVGLFINTIPVRLQAPAGMLFSHLLRAMQQASVESSHYHYTQLVAIQAASEPGSQLFDHILVFENYPVQDMMAEDSETSRQEMPVTLLSMESHEQSNYNFSLAITPGQQLNIRFTYNGSVYTSAFMQRLSKHFRQVLEQVVTHPETAIAHISLLPEAEKEALLALGTGFVNGEQPWSNETIIPLFTNQARLTPEAIAVQFETTQLTYQELDTLSTRFAGFLIARFGVGANDLVAIQLPRSEWIIVSILAIWKSGAAYMPVDLHYPQERIDYMLQDSRCKASVDVSVLAHFRQESYSYTTTALPARNTAKDLAYLIYTSGSTGKPKGVQVTQESLVSFAMSTRLTFGSRYKVKMPLLASHAFDIFLFETLLPLLSGGTAIMLSEEQVIDTAYLGTQLKKANAFHAVPAFMTQIIKHILSENSHKEYTGIKDLYVGGDAVPTKVLKAMRTIFSQADIHVLYGPTESTIFVTACHYLHNEPAVIDGAIIGRPNRNACVYITDAYGQPAPEGIVGEICIGGLGVAKGYLHQPVLTAEKFVHDPFLHGATMYRTGDLGKWLPDGNIAFAGRMDGQVKIRGYRIELGEIESVLQRQPGVSEAVVLMQVKANGDKDLVAFTVHNTPLSIEELRGRLSAALPSYMVPAQFVLLKELPLTPNGKVDKKALSQYNVDSVTSTVAYIPPRNAVEEKLVLIWQSILEKKQIGVQDDFFLLGGHSLKIIRLSSHILKELNVKLSVKSLFAASKLEDQAQLIQQGRRDAQTVIVPAATQESYPLSSSQRRIWLMSQFQDANAAYNMPAIYMLEGSYDQTNLEQAFQLLLQRHEILRTAFREGANGEVRQYILPADEHPFRVSFLDLRDQEQQEDRLQNHIRSEFLQPFDLTRGCLLRAGIFQLAHNKWAFVLVIHHIICDGWSMGILINELFALYHASKVGLPFALPSLGIQYKDYAVWQQQQLKTGGLQKQQAYWLTQLGGELPVLEMPSDRIRPAFKTYNGGVVKTVLNAQLTRHLKTLNQQQGTTTFMSLLSLVSILLHRYTSQEDMIIGSPIAGREQSNLEEQIGFYLNTLPLRIEVGRNDCYHTLLEKVKKITLDAYEHQAYPFDELVDALMVKHDQRRNPLFDVMVVLQNADSHAVQSDQLSGLTMSAYEVQGTPSSKFDLLFEFIEDAGTILANVEYNSDIYEHSTIVRLSQHLEQLLAALIAKPSLPVSGINYLAEREIETLLYSFNDTGTPRNPLLTITALFEAQVNATPDKTALIFESVSLTYRELNVKSNQLAHYLRSLYDIQAGELVGIRLERSEWLIIAILGVLKSGGGYLPLELSYPQERIDYMLGDSQCKLVIDEAWLVQFMSESTGYAIENPETDTTAHHLAYVMYTSGSTGRSKGVVVEHRSVVRLVKDTNFVALTGDEVLLSTGAISFDAVTFEYWSMLLNGGTLVLCSKEVLLDEEQLSDLIRSRRVDMMWFTAGWLNHLIDSDIALFRGLKTVLAGGDKLSVAHMQALRTAYPSMQLINGYGPTENTTFSLTYSIHMVPDPIPVGKSIRSSTAYIVDGAGQLCPIGVVGEIYVGGAGLAREYLNNPALTAEKFVNSCFLPGERLYRTGDLGRWLEDGNILFMGRQDAQVKIRGYRIELGEIEHELQNYPGVDAVVVVDRLNITGEKELVAYIVSKQEVDVTALLASLYNSLPVYMHPAHFVQLGALPLTPNGKVDRRKLPEPEGGVSIIANTYVAPDTDIEKQLAEIWEEVLGREKVGITDNFFELGGHSIKASRLAGRIRQVFNIRFSLVLLFHYPTIESIAVEIEKIHWANKEVVEMDDAEHFSI